MKAKRTSTNVFILLFLGTIALGYLLKYISNTMDFGQEHFADDFIQILSLSVCLSFNTYITDRKRTLTDKEFKTTRKVSVLLVFFFVWIAVLAAEIIKNHLMQVEINWLKLIVFGLGWSVIIMLFTLLMAKYIPFQNRIGQKGK